jgi:hypothetical protein
MTSQQILRAIQFVHSLPEWACFAEVRNATGFNGNRSADAVAMNLWPSRGLTIRGFEIKVSRGDLRSEIAQPQKAEAIAQYCDEWWIVTPDGLSRDIDIPAAWGIMEVRGEKLVTRRKAERTPAEPITRDFAAALLRRSADHLAHVTAQYVRRDEIAEQLEERYRAGVAAAPREAKWALDALQKKVDGARPVLAALGLDIDEQHRWDQRIDVAGPDVVKALQLGRALTGRYDGDVARVASLLDSATDELTKCRDRMRALARKVAT